MNTLTQSAEIRFLNWVVEKCNASCKSEEIETDIHPGNHLLDMGAWLDDIDEILEKDPSCRAFEMSENHSASGKPELYYFTDNDLAETGRGA